MTIHSLILNLLMKFNAPFVTSAPTIVFYGGTDLKLLAAAQGAHKF